jgi:hypothetical protein
VNSDELPCHAGNNFLAIHSTELKKEMMIVGSLLFGLSQLQNRQKISSASEMNITSR